MRLATLALLTLMFGCAQKKDVDALDARLKAAEDKIAALEKGGVHGASAAQATPAVPPEQEEAATKLMATLQDQRKANDYAGANATLTQLTTDYAQTRAGKAAARMAPEIKLIGSDAAPIEVDKWFTGKPVKYSDAKATLVVFWEAWCPHCKKEVPKLPDLLAKHKSQGLQVVAVTKVTKSATDEIVQKFIEDNKLDFPVGKENGSMSQAFAVSGIPAAAIVKGGKVIWRGHPAQLTDDVLNGLLAG